LLDVSVLIEHFAAATAAHCAGRREAGVMTEALADDNPGGVGAAAATPSSALLLGLSANRNQAPALPDAVLLLCGP